MCVPTPSWNVNIFNAKMMRDTICVGVGMGSKGIVPNLYTRCLLKKILSHKYIHSTRDERTAEFLRNIGFKAINTGCATTWGLTNDICHQIPKSKAETVVFTLTDYMRDIESDKYLISTLKKLYRKVYFWIQGIEDYAYVTSLVEKGEIEIISPNLQSFSQILAGNVDYVGTRLHAGIKALQNKKRTIIIEVDNRASDMKESINLPTIKRTELVEKLEMMILSDFETKLNINTEAIDKWRQQF
jgi:polysaccharide pyruvyl transferase WcaK-like protein